MIDPRLILFFALANGVAVVGPTPIRTEPSACFLQAPSESHLWLFCYDRILYSSTDRGESWKKRDLPEVALAELEHSNGLILVHLKGDGVGWTFAGGVAFRTRDDGNTWSPFFEVHEGSVSSVSVSPDGTWIVALVEKEDGSREILNSRDAGKTWSRRSAPILGRVVLRRVFHASDTIAYAASEDAIWCSRDAGESWAPAKIVFSPASGAVNRYLGNPMSMSFASLSGWLVYDNGTMFRTTDGGKTWVETARSTQIWPDNSWPGSFAVRFLTTDHGYQVGGDGVLRESRDGGLVWHPVALDGERVADLTCFDIRSCYALTDRQRVLRVEATGAR
jgi:hypothetical protein